jgi:hypothetical protein
MRPNKKEPESAPFWFQSMSIQVTRMAASYNKPVGRMAASYTAFSNSLKDSCRHCA